VAQAKDVEGRTPAAPGDGPNPYGAFIAERLSEQESRRDSIQNRAVGVLTVVGTLATLLLGLVAAITSQTDYSIPTWSARFLYAAVVAFVAAGVAAVWTNVPRKYQNVTTPGLRALVDDLWEDSPADAELRVARTKVTIFGVAKERNTIAARWLSIAICINVVAIGFLALAVISILYER
jgi:hypothetical protein